MTGNPARWLASFMKKDLFHDSAGNTASQFHDGVLCSFRSIAGCFLLTHLSLCEKNLRRAPRPTRRTTVVRITTKPGGARGYNSLLLRPIIQRGFGIASKPRGARHDSASLKGRLLWRVFHATLIANRFFQGRHPPRRAIGDSASRLRPDVPGMVNRC